MYRTYEEWLDAYKACREMLNAIDLDEDGFEEQKNALMELIDNYRAFYYYFLVNTKYV